MTECRWNLKRNHMAKLHEEDWLLVKLDERLDNVVFFVEVDWLEKDMIHDS